MISAHTSKGSAPTPDGLIAKLQGLCHSLTPGQHVSQPPMRLDEQQFLECALVGTSYRPHEVAAIALATSGPDETKITGVYATGAILFLAMKDKDTKLRSLAQLTGLDEPHSLRDQLSAGNLEVAMGYATRQRPTQIVELGYEGDRDIIRNPHLLLLYVRAVGAEAKPVGTL